MDSYTSEIQIFNLVDVPTIMQRFGEGVVECRCADDNTHWHATKNGSFRDNISPRQKPTSNCAHLTCNLAFFGPSSTNSSSASAFSSTIVTSVLH